MLKEVDEYIYEHAMFFFPLDIGTHTLSSEYFAIYIAENKTRDKKII